METMLPHTSRRIPAFMHIVNIVQERIDKGYYVPGEWLPTERDLSLELKVSRPVIQVAFKHLREQGLVIQQGPGHRSRVSPRSGNPEDGSSTGSTSRMIAAIMSQSPSLVCEHAVLRGVNATLRDKEAPYQLVIYDTDATPAPGGNKETRVSWEIKYLERIEQEGAAGVILRHVGGEETKPIVRAIQDQGIPVVMIDRYADEMDCDFVGTDNREASRTAVEYLLSLGHRRIGYVTSFEIVTSVEERLRGYKDALEAYGIPYEPELVTSVWPHARLAFDHYRRLSQPPTAIAAVHDFAAFALIHEAQSRDIRVPEDLSVIGFDDIESYSPRPGMLTTIRQPFYEIGRRAAELVLRTQGTQRSHRHIILPASLIVRTSCAAPSDVPD